MLSIIRKVAVIAIFVLGIGATMLSWIIFHNLLSIFIKAAITCTTLFVTVLPKNDQDLMMAAIFIFFDVGIVSVFILGETNIAIAFFGLGQSFLFFCVLMLLSGIVIHNKIYSWKDLCPAIVGSKNTTLAVPKS